MIQLFLEDIAGSEILLILVFVLIFFGSKSIPGIARTMGKTLRQIRDASDELKHEIKKSTNEIKNDFEIQNTFNQHINTFSKPLDQITDDLESAVNTHEINDLNNRNKIEQEIKKIKSEN